MIIHTPLDQLPSNLAIVDNRGFPTQAFVFYLLKMFKKAQNDVLNFESLQKEIDDTQTGAGLQTDGTYSSDLTANYIAAASSLFTADILLDLALHYLQIEVNNVEDGAGLNLDGTYTPDTLANYISTAISLKDADSKLDSKLYDIIQRVVTITANYTALVGNYSIFADATAGSITVTLPAASTATAFIIGVTKIDASANSVIITGTGTDTIAGEVSQSLLYDAEVLNFVSDGTNWQLAN